MKVDVAQKTPIHKVLSVKVEPEYYMDMYNEIINEVAKNIHIKGFRPGKAPLNMVIRKIGADSIKNELLDKLIPDAAMKALEQHKIFPLGTLQCTPYHEIDFTYGKPIDFEITVEVKPEFDLNNYKGLTLTKPPQNIDIDKLVEDKITALREQAGEMEPIEEERGLELGDIAYVDFRSFLNGEPVENGTAEDYYMTVEEENFIPGFVNHLIGRKPEEEWEFDVVFPENYSNIELSGKEVHFKIKLHGIFKKNLPELNDEFAKTVSGKETFEEFKQSMKEDFEASVKDQEKSMFQEQIINHLIKNEMKDVEVPPSLVEHHLNVFFENLDNRLKQMGKNIENYFEEQNLTPDKVWEKFHPMALEMAQGELILDKLAEKENIVVSDEEVDAELDKIAKRLNQSLEFIRNAMEKSNGIGKIKYSLRNKKVYDLIIENATIVEKSEETPDEVKEDQTEESSLSEAEREEPVKADSAEADSENHSEVNKDKAVEIAP